MIGGKPFSRGALYLMLRNRTYRGEIIHKGQSHPGEHTPIIDREKLVPGRRGRLLSRWRKQIFQNTCSHAHASGASDRG